MIQINDWLTTKDAAEFSGYHIEHIRRLIRAGELRARKWGRDWMVDRSSIIDYVKNVEAKGNRKGPKPK